MRIEEQIARALVEIAKEIKGIRRAVEDMRKQDTAENEGIRCPWNGAFCTGCTGEACEYRSTGGAENG